VLPYLKSPITKEKTTMSEEFFTILFKDDTTLPEVEEIRRFFSIGELFRYLTENKERKISIYSATCIADWS
jgi:hypothetical protein